ncbi:MAG: hypothetical protein JJE46_01000 [Acidimicrobiia bacterium]|nr:hypothetical protein [Acidimicrobiia bacterium]
MTAVGTHRDRVRVSGADTWTFLQSLLSQDLDGIVPGERRPTLLLTPQGKVDVLAGITRDGDDALLDTEPGWGEQLRSSLARFVIRTKVDISIEPAAPVDDATRAADEARRIAAGVPRLGAELDQTVIPQEAMLEQDAVSFTKGCFIGQELVCRIDSRGHVNRFLRHVVPEAADLVLPVGAPITIDDKAVGTITSATAGIALGYVRREIEPPAGATVDGHQVLVQLLPTAEPDAAL